MDPAWNREKAQQVAHCQRLQLKELLRGRKTPQEIAESSSICRTVSWYLIKEEKA